jgi:hypothetical protein
MLAACVSDVSVPTEADQVMAWKLRGDWTGKTSGRPNCYQRWILISSMNGDFEEGCEGGPQKDYSRTTQGLWRISGNELQVTYLSADRGDRPTEGRYSIERSDENSFEIRDANGGVLWTFYKTSF